MRHRHMRRHCGSGRVTWEVKQGHVLDVLRSMEADSVNCVVTSPPYVKLIEKRMQGARTPLPGIFA